MKQSTRDNLVMLGVVAVIVVTAVLVFFRPQQKRLDELRAVAAARQATLQSDEQRASVVPQMLQQVQQMRAQYRDFDRKLPKQKELGGFLKDITGNLAGHQLANQLIEPGNPHREDLFHTLPINMKFEGDYLSMASFLKQIDQMERLTRVQKLSISADSKQQKPLKIEVLLNIYFTES